MPAKSPIHQIFRDLGVSEPLIDQFSSFIQNICDSLSNALVITDSAFNVLFWSQLAESWLGWKAGEIVGRPFPFAENGVKSQKPASRIVKCCLPDGKTRQFQKWSSPVHDSLGSKVATIVILCPVEPASPTRDALMESERRYQAIVDFQAGAVCRWLPNTELTFVSDGYCEFLGLEKEKLLGAQWIDLLPEAMKKDALAHIQQLLKTGKTQYFVTKAPVKDGAFRHLYWTDVPIKNQSGSVVEVQSVGTDITDHVKVADALRDSEEKYRHLFEMESDAIFVIENETGQILDVNQAATQMYGYSREELLQKKNTDMSAEPESTRKATKDELLRVPIRRHRRKDGTIIYVEIAASHFMLGGKKVHAAAIRDITARINAEQELEEQKQFLRNTIDAIPNFVFVKDMNTRFILANEFFARSFGTTPEKLMGTTVFDIFSDKTIASAMHDDDLAVLSGSVPKIERHEQYIGQDGRRRWLHTVKLPMKNSEGQIYQLLGISQDITERIEAESALRESEERFVQFMGNIPAAVFISDEESRLLYVNQYFRSLFKLSDNWLGKTLGEFVDPNLCVVLQHHDQIALQQGVLVVTESIPHGKDSMRHLEAHRFVINRPGKKRLLGGICIDTTDLRRSEEERLRLEEQLVQALKMEAIGQLAGGVAHDFNNLLSPILGYADMALMQLKESDPLYLDILQIREAADRGASLTRQLLAFSRKQVLDAKITSLNHCVEEFAKMLRRLIGENIVLATSLDPALGFVKADATQIQQILMNLAVNARDAMPSGGTLIIETANTYLDSHYVKTRRTVKPGHYVLLAVNDTGIGMAPELIEHIFEPFFTTKDRGKGTGLGLSTVYGLVKQHGGHIEVTSEPGKGSSFRIYLPRIENDPQRSAASGEDQIVGGNETILVVEDEELVRNLTVDLLKNHGYNVIHAANAKEAIQMQEDYKGRIDLLLTDVIMPGQNGRELHDALSLIRPGLPVLYMSGYIDDLITRHGIMMASSNFVQKPFTVAGLLQKVRSVIEQHNPALEVES